MEALRDRRGRGFASVNPDESASLQCANFPRFACACRRPAGADGGSGQQLWGCTVPSKGFNNGMRFGGIGLIALGIVLFVIQVIGAKRPATGKCT